MGFRYGLTRGFALDLAPIRVNCIAPGAVETELWNPMREQGIFDKVSQGFKDKSTTKQIGQVEDVVMGYLNILQDKNMTGKLSPWGIEHSFEFR